MNKSLSVYLEALRWLAALGVFAFHFSILIAPSLSGFLTSNGPECVAAFFVLSGFVIRFVTLEKERGWRDYANARMARMYSVIFLALAVTLIADHLGSQADPSVYRAHSWYQPHLSVLSLLSYATFTGELWLRHSFIGTNEPFWSLGFEVPYYVVFGLAMFAPARWRAGLIAVWAVIVGPKILAYLPLWLLGVVTYDIIAQKRIGAARPRAAGLALMAGSVALFVLNRYGLQPKHFANMFAHASVVNFSLSWGYFMITGAAVAMNIVGFALFAQDGVRWNPKLASAIRWFAGGSFTLYLTHDPLLVAARALFPAARTNLALGLAVGAAVYALTLLLAEIGERRKRFYKRAIARLLANLVPPRLRPAE